MRQGRDDAPAARSGTATRPGDQGRTYRRRPVRFLRTVAMDGWQMKIYGIAARAEQPRAELVDAAVAAARQRLPRPATGAGRYGAGFVIAHDGEDGCWILVCWWVAEILHHVVLRADVARPGAPAVVTDPTLTACTWELAVVAFERDAWVDALRTSPPDTKGYLQRRLKADV